MPFTISVQRGAGAVAGRNVLGFGTKGPASRARVAGTLKTQDRRSEEVPGLQLSELSGRQLGAGWNPSDGVMSHYKARGSE